MYKFAQYFFFLLFKLLFHWKIEGIENVPKQGGAIIAANHISLWDPPLIGTAITRPVHFMAKEELFNNRLLNMIISKLHAFPVRRGAADRNAIRKAITLLEQGNLLGLFPEGTRSKTGQLGKPEAGIAMIAVKANVPIIPTAIIGTNKIFTSGFFLPTFIIRFGQPIYPIQDSLPRTDLSLLSDKLMSEIDKLLISQMGK